LVSASFAPVSLGVYSSNMKKLLIVFLLLVTSLRAVVISGTKTLDVSKTSPQFGQSSWSVTAQYTYDTVSKQGSVNWSCTASTGTNAAYKTLVFAGYEQNGGVVNGGLNYSFNDPNAHSGTGTFGLTGTVTGLYLATNWINGGTTESRVNIPLDMTQTCSISNPVVPDIVGHSITGNASGAESGNPYNISVTSGSISAAINSTTGAYTIIANGPGPATYKVWISEGGGYTRSNDAQGSGTIAEGYKVTITIPANTGDFTIIYTVTQDGVIVGSTTQPPHSNARIVVITVPNDHPVTVSSRTVGIKWEDGHNVVTNNPADGVDNPDPTIVNPSQNPSNPPTPVNPPPTNNSTDPGNPSNSGGEVWTDDPNTTDPAQQTDLLTNKTFREGIEKLVTPSKFMADLMEAATQKEASAETAATQQRADLANSNEAALSAGQSAANQGLTAATNALSDKLGPVPTSSSIGSVPAATDDVIELGMGYGRTVSLHTNPFTPNGPFGGVLAKVATFLRALISWGIVIVFYLYVLREVNKACEAFFKVAPFSKSIEDSINSIKAGGFGGGMGYLARTIGLLLLVPFVLTLPLAILAAATGGLPLAQILALFAGGAPSPDAGMLQSAVSIVDQIIPWSLLMVTPVWYVIVQYGILPAKMFWMMFSKFIPL